MVCVNTLGLVGANGCVVPGKAMDMNNEFFALDARTGKTLYTFNSVDIGIAGRQSRFGTEPSPVPRVISRADSALTRSEIPISSGSIARVPLVSRGDSDPRATQWPSQ